jgi:hypothetical protein
MKTQHPHTLRTQFEIKKSKTLYEIVGPEKIFEEIRRRQGHKLILQLNSEFKAENQKVVCDFLGGELQHYSNLQDNVLGALLTIDSVNYEILFRDILDLARPKQILEDPSMNITDYQFLSNEEIPTKYPAKNPFEAYLKLRELNKIPPRATLIKILQQENGRKPGKIWDRNKPY